MRACVLLLALMGWLLVACSDNAPAPTPDALPATPSPVLARDATPGPPGDPGDPPPESSPQPTPQAPSTPAAPASVPAGALTIVALGDSLTEGEGDESEAGGGYPARLARAINELRPNSQVINLGKSGWTSTEMIEGQLPTALEAGPSLALVWIGSNDLWQNNGPEQEAAELARYTASIDQALRALTERGARVYIALLDDQSQRPYTTSPDGAGLSPEGVAYMSRLGSLFNEAIRAKAAEYGAATVDFYNTTIFTDPATLAADGVHPNARGYDQIAQIWFEALRPDLQ